jgi:2Fe-2S ferredoxin
MPLLHFVMTNPSGELVTHAVHGRSGQSLMQAAQAARLEAIAADCGGLLTCATCHVYLPDAWLDRLPPASDDEASMLAFVAAERRKGSRLSCQITLTEQLEGLTVELPVRQY